MCAILFAFDTRTWIIFHKITSKIVSSISLDEVLNGLAVVIHPCPLCHHLQPYVIEFVVMDTIGRFIVTPMAQIDRHAVCIGSLAVFATEDVMFFRLSKPTADVAHLFCVAFDNAFTHTPTPLLEFQVHRRAAR